MYIELYSVVPCSRISAPAFEDRPEQGQDVADLRPDRLRADAFLVAALRHRADGGSPSSSRTRTPARAWSARSFRTPASSARNSRRVDQDADVLAGVAEQVLPGLARDAAAVRIDADKLRLAGVGAAGRRLAGARPATGSPPRSPAAWLQPTGGCGAGHGRG